MDGNWNVLCLKTRAGDLDLTKGIIDPGEDPFETAIREAKEEANISDLAFPFGKDVVETDACVMYIGVTNQEPEILSNPHTGIKEHAGYVWMPILEAVNSNKIKKFLQPAVERAFELTLKDKQRS